VAGAWQPSKIYTSPMGRCIETGAAIAKACGAPTEVCDDLTDINYGDWQFKTFDEAKSQNPALFAAWFATPHLIRFPNGESLQDLAARAANALRFVLARHPDGTVVLVCHDSVNRAMLMQLIDQPLSAYWRIAQSPCCLNEIDITGGKISVQRVNETAHLEALAR
jgi:probable phosphoglycerate mutase